MEQAPPISVKWLEREPRILFELSVRNADLRPIVALALLLVLQSILTPEQLGAWGWRIPFAIGGSWPSRSSGSTRPCTRPPSFQNAEDHRGKTCPPRPYPFHAFARVEAFTVLALTSAGSLAFYAYTTYLQKFLVNTSGFSKDHPAEITALALLAFMLVQPLAGALSDRVGRKPLMVGFGILGVMFTYPSSRRWRRRPPLCRLRPVAGRTVDRYRLHLDQRGCESRTLPGAYPRTRCGAPLCSRQYDLRRHRRMGRIETQATRS